MFGRQFRQRLRQKIIRRNRNHAARGSHQRRLFLEQTLGAQKIQQTRIEVLGIRPLEQVIAAVWQTIRVHTWHQSGDVIKLWLEAKGYKILQGQTIQGQVDTRNLEQRFARLRGQDRLFVQNRDAFFERQRPFARQLEHLHHQPHASTTRPRHKHAPTQYEARLIAPLEHRLVIQCADRQRDQHAPTRGLRFAVHAEVSKAGLANIIR